MIICFEYYLTTQFYLIAQHSDRDRKNCPKNQIFSENISWASIYPSHVIEVHFSVKCPPVQIHFLYEIVQKIELSNMVSKSNFANVQGK